MGRHPLTALIRNDLEQQGVGLIDAAGDCTTAPPISSILITQGAGDRAVISANDSVWSSEENSSGEPPDIGQLVLLDGYNMDLCLAAARAGRERNVPVVLDGGSWKPGMEELLQYVNIAICSAAFQLPGSDRSEAAEGLLQRGIEHVAVTRGAKPILYRSRDGRSAEIPVPPTEVIDTLAAGDFFHGAFCFALLESRDAVQALSFAQQVASLRCRSFGTRSWLRSALLDGMAGH